MQIEELPAPAGASERRRWRRLRALALRAAELLAWSAFFVFAALFLVLRYWLLPDVERYRGDVVVALSRAIGLPVAIGRIEVDWMWLRPQLSISDVRVYGQDGREALSLPSVENVIAWSSLLHGELRLHSLVIDRPRLRVRRDATGAIYVAGIRLQSGSEDSGLTDWVLAQREIAIRDAEIEWLDEQRRAPPLALEALNFRLRNDGDEHAIGMVAKPPPALGTSLELRAALDGSSVTEPGAWSGRVYVELGSTDLAGWRRWVDYPIDLRAGRGALRLWASLGAGELRRATADVALEDVRVRLGRDLPLLELAAVTGRLQGSAADEHYELSGRDLALRVEGGPVLRPTSFALSWIAGTAGAPERGALTATRIELQPLAELAGHLPFPAELRRLLDELAPQGQVHDANFAWSGALPQAAQFTATARLDNLGIRAWNSVPGFAGISGSLSANEKRGVVTLDSGKAEIDLPKVFPEPRIRLASLKGRIEWEGIGAERLRLHLASLAFANEDFAGTATGEYHLGADGPGAVDLSVGLSYMNGRSTARYLPLSSIMGETTRNWLAGAIVAGTVSDAQLRLKGDLRDFPFIDPKKGQFQVSARVAGGVLRFSPDWPGIEDIDADLVFERDWMEVRGRRGAILGARLSAARVHIPDLLSARVEISVSGQVEGDSGQFLRYVKESPLRRTVGAATDSMSATGRAQLQLRLGLPLADLSRTKVSGEIRLSGNAITLYPGVPPIERAAGILRFSESSFTLEEARGRVFGGAISASGGTRSEGGLRVLAQGDAEVDTLRAHLPAMLGSGLGGAFAYTADLTAQEGLARISINSNLLGVRSDLPAPFAKDAPVAMPFRIDIVPGADATRVTAKAGAAIAAEVVRERGEGDRPVVRAVVALGKAANEALRRRDVPGLLVYGELPDVNLDRWLERAAGEGRSSAVAEDVPDLDLAAERFEVRGKQFGRVQLTGHRDGADWRLDRFAVANPEANLAVDGVWHGAGIAYTTMNFRIDARDSGKLLERLGYPGLLQGGQTRLRGRVAWNDDPFSIDYPSLTGEIQELDSRDGQFLQIDPGAGRLLSLLSLQALPRRLIGDFGDVVHQGFRYTRIAGTASINRGVLATGNFTMSGSAAAVSMKGEIDLAHETQNMHIRIVPNVGDSACTLGLLVNPALWLQTCLAAKILPLGRVFAAEYNVTGTWKQPRVEKAGAPAPVKAE